MPGPHALAQPEVKKRILILLTWGNEGEFSYYWIKSPWRAERYYSPISRTLPYGISYELAQNKLQHDVVKVSIMRHESSKEIVIGTVEADVDELRFRLCRKQIGELNVQLAMVYD
ncbi:MAG: hypothetical protein K1X53_12700 [Candidatus Sumerlaeaceae bacterium]|nr:hypothetical protein [Candidatus Sumerlaeaceae bacterium]